MTFSTNVNVNSVSQAAVSNVSVDNGSQAAVNQVLICSGSQAAATQLLNSSDSQVASQELIPSCGSQMAAYNVRNSNDSQAAANKVVSSGSQAAVQELIYGGGSQAAETDLSTSNGRQVPDDSPSPSPVHSQVLLDSTEMEVEVCSGQRKCAHSSSENAPDVLVRLSFVGLICSILVFKVLSTLMVICTPFPLCLVVFVKVVLCLLCSMSWCLKCCLLISVPIHVSWASLYLEPLPLCLPFPSTAMTLPSWCVPMTPLWHLLKITLALKRAPGLSSTSPSRKGCGWGLGVGDWTPLSPWTGHRLRSRCLVYLLVPMILRSTTGIPGLLRWRTFSLPGNNDLCLTGVGLWSLMLWLYPGFGMWLP